MLILLGVFVVAACAELAAVTAPTDGGAPADAQIPDAGLPDAELPDAQAADGGTKADAGPPTVFETVGAVCPANLVNTVDVGNRYKVACGIVGTPMASVAPTSWLGVGGRFGATCGSANDSIDPITVGNGFVPRCDGGKTVPSYIGTEVQVSVK